MQCIFKKRSRMLDVFVFAATKKRLRKYVLVSHTHTFPSFLSCKLYSFIPLSLCSSLGSFRIQLVGTEGALEHVAFRLAHRHHLLGPAPPLEPADGPTNGPAEVGPQANQLEPSIEKRQTNQTEPNPTTLPM